MIKWLIVRLLVVEEFSIYKYLNMCWYKNITKLKLESHFRYFESPDISMFCWSPPKFKILMFTWGSFNLDTNVWNDTVKSVVITVFSDIFIIYFYSSTQRIEVVESKWTNIDTSLFQYISLTVLPYSMICNIHDTRIVWNSYAML